MILYRLAISLMAPVLLAQAVVQALRGVIPWGGVADRLGGAGAHLPGQRRIWLHGASLGEVASARPVLERMLTALPDHRVILTTNSGPARAMVAGWALPRVQVALAPFDLGWALARFRRRWQPDALILIESELWPMRMAAMRQSPVVLIGARLSGRAAARWQRFAPGTLRQMLAGVTFLSAQDGQSEARFLDLGLPRAALGPRAMLKAHTAAAPAPPPFPAPALRAQTLLAASTHAGDDGPILDAFLAARAAGAFRHLILAPRHPQRAAEIAGLIRARGLSLAQWSRGDVPGPQTDVFLADTLGDMQGWYGMAGATLIGGTFSNRGGHTPYEPAAQGSAIIHGPDVANFAEAYAALADADAALSVGDLPGLGPALLAMSAERQAELTDRARAALVGGDLGPLMAALLAAVAPDQGSGRAAS